MGKLSLGPRADRNSWLALAASFLIGAVLAGVTTFGALNYGASDDVAAEIVSAHVRALMAPQPIDVASSDDHTVKPGSTASSLSRRPSSISALMVFPWWGGASMW